MISHTSPAHVSCFHSRDAGLRSWVTYRGSAASHPRPLAAHECASQALAQMGLRAEVLEFAERPGALPVKAARCSPYSWLLPASAERNHRKLGPHWDAWFAPSQQPGSPPQPARSHHLRQKLEGWAAWTAIPRTLSKGSAKEIFEGFLSCGASSSSIKTLPQNRWSKFRLNSRNHAQLLPSSRQSLSKPRAGKLKSRPAPLPKTFPWNRLAGGSARLPGLGALAPGLFEANLNLPQLAALVPGPSHYSPVLRGRTPAAKK